VPEDRARIHKECFDLAFFSEAAITIPQVYELPIYLRYFYLKCLQNVREKEKEQAEQKERFDGKIVRKA
jgi:hypothetical protein